MLKAKGAVSEEGFGYLGTRLAIVLEDIANRGSDPVLKAEFEKLLKNCSDYAIKTYKNLSLSGLLIRDTKYKSLLGLPIDIVKDNPDIHVETLDKAVEAIDFAIATMTIPKPRALRLMCDELKGTIYANKHLLYVDLLGIYVTPIWEVEFSATGMVKFLKRFHEPSEKQEVIIQKSANVRVETNTAELYKALVCGAEKEVKREQERINTYLEEDVLTNPDGDWVAINKLPPEALLVPIVIARPPVNFVTFPIVDPIEGCSIASGVDGLILKLYNCKKGDMPTVIYMQPGNDAEWMIGNDTVYAFKYLTLVVAKYPGVIANLIRDLEAAHKAETSDTDMAKIRVCRDLAYQFLYEIDMGMVKRNGKLDHVTVLNDFDFNMYVREYIPMLVPALVDMFGTDITYRIFPEVITPENPGFGETTSHVTQVQIEIASALLQILAEK